MGGRLGPLWVAGIVESSGWDLTSSLFSSGTLHFVMADGWPKDPSITVSCVIILSMEGIHHAEVSDLG